MYIYIYTSGTQMTLLLTGKDLVWEGSTTKIKNIHRLQVYIIYIIYTRIYIYIFNTLYAPKNRSSPKPLFARASGQGLTLSTLAMSTATLRHGHLDLAEVRRGKKAGEAVVRCTAYGCNGLGATCDFWKTVCLFVFFLAIYRYYITTTHF